MLTKLLRHKLVSTLSALSFAFVLGGIFWCYFALRNIKSLLILHWSDMAGVTQAGGWGTMVGIGVVGFLVVIVNSAIAFELDSRDTFLGRFAAATTLALAILIFIAAAAIISVN